MAFFNFMFQILSLRVMGALKLLIVVILGLSLGKEYTYLYNFSLFSPEC